MGIENWVTFAPSAKNDGKDEEIDSAAQRRLADTIQSRLRNQIDPGIDIKSARRAQSIRVQANGGQFTIDEDDQAKLFSGGAEQATDDGEPPAGNLDDLFRPGSGVPEAIGRPDGSTQLVFRSINASDLFGQQIANRQSEMVERSVTDSIQTGLVDAIETAAKELSLTDVGKPES